MAFITGSDETGVVDVTFFPRTYQEYNLTKNSIILLEGRVEKRYNRYKIIALKILDITLQGSN